MRKTKGNEPGSSEPPDSVAYVQLGPRECREVEIDHAAIRVELGAAIAVLRSPHPAALAALECKHSELAADVERLLVGIVGRS